MADDALLSRVEDAGINASAPPQQRWMDGWIVRTSPGKAKRARCINAVANGRLPLDQKLALAAAVYAEAGLPMVVRITRFSQPVRLDDELAARGFSSLDDTRVMVCTALPRHAPALPAGLALEPMASDAFAAEVGAMRESPAEQIRAHAERLATSPVPYRGWVLRREGRVLACGQTATEGDLVGLYDVFTREEARGQGLARLLCEHLLSKAASGGAMVGYLQCEATNDPARHIYHRLGFADGYAYHYRQAPAGFSG